MIVPALLVVVVIVYMVVAPLFLNVIATPFLFKQVNVIHIPSHKPLVEGSAIVLANVVLKNTFL